MTNTDSNNYRAKGAKITFGEFMKRVDAILVSICGMQSDDLADCAWMDLYEYAHDLEGDDLQEEVLNTAVEYNEGLEALL